MDMDGSYGSREQQSARSLVWVLGTGVAILGASLLSKACASGETGGEGGSATTTSTWTTSDTGGGSQAGFGGSGGIGATGGGGSGGDATGGGSVGGGGGAGGAGATGGSAAGGSGGSGTGGSGTGGGGTVYSHTITVDGVNNGEWSNTDERFATPSTGYYGYYAWDSTYLYVGMEGSDVGATSSATKWVLLYISGASGTTTGQPYTTQTPGLPFSARYHLGWRTDEGHLNTKEWTGSWADTWTPGATIAKTGDFVEMQIPLSAIGSPSTVNVHLNVLNEENGLESSYACVPSTSHGIGHDPDYAHYYSFDLSGTGVPTSYAIQ